MRPVVVSQVQASRQMILEPQVHSLFTIICIMRLMAAQAWRRSLPSLPRFCAFQRPPTVGKPQHPRQFPVYALQSR
jgi:hypothetical protein